MKAAKAVTAFILSVVTVLGVVLSDNAVDAGEISSTVAAVIDAGLLLASALGVYAVPNSPPASAPPKTSAESGKVF